MDDVPATTCALVSTSCGPITNPLPSSIRWHDGARPRILRTLERTSLMAASFFRAASGGPASVIGVCENGLVTSGKPELFSS